MRYTVTTALLVTALAVASSALASTPKKPASSATKTTAPATHAVQGVVKSIDASSLVIAKSGHKAEMLSFMLDSSTAREGTVDVGSTVSVRYRSEGKTLMATAIAAHPAPAAHAAKTK